MSRKQRIAWIASALVAFGAGWLVGRPADPWRISAEEMEREVGAALLEPDTLTRTVQLSRLMERVHPDNLPGALAAVDDFIWFIEPGDLRLFVHTWARFDPTAAFEYARTWPVTAKQSYGMSEVAYIWALHGKGREALETVRSLPKKQREEVTNGLVSGWAKSGDIAGATDFVASMHDGKQRDFLTSLVIAHQLNGEGPDAVIAWADGIDPEAPRRYKLTAFRQSVRHITRRDPSRATSWLERHAGEPWTDGATRVAATVWSDREPEAALAWLLSRPAGAERDSALSIVVSRWLSRDAEAAAAWLRLAASSADLDPAHAAHARWLSEEHPEQAVAWTERIVDEELRMQTLQTVAVAWYARAPARAESWLASSPLPEDVRTAVRRTPRRPVPRRLPANVEISVE